ncbi:hypothetical protein GHT06_021141 [Daphnia sinensis]|uniref:Uncharacterized protein n=1 Tax=Daphnia sinensis TaxID=1820382 RepID=A0AAD5PS95_9CRUS|nr:hypothetical protein GHT06_021141 [Daphnia sinensis]
MNSPQRMQPIKKNILVIQGGLRSWRKMNSRNEKSITKLLLITTFTVLLPCMHRERDVGDGHQSSLQQMDSYQKMVRIIKIAYVEWRQRKGTSQFNCKESWYLASNSM